MTTQPSERSSAAPEQSEGASPAANDSQLPLLVAQWQWIQFVAYALQEKRLPAATQLLPLAEVPLLCREAIELFQEMIPQGVVRWLCYHRGWLPVLHLDWSSQRISTKRLWETSVWQRLQLSFSDASVDFFLLAFNLYSRAAPQIRFPAARPTDAPPPTQRREPSARPAQQQTPEASNRETHSPSPALRQSGKAPELSALTSSSADWLPWLLQHPPKTVGDLFVHHLIFRQISSSYGFQLVLGPLFTHANPLNALWRPDLLTSDRPIDLIAATTADEAPLQIAGAVPWQLLCEGVVAELLPWLLLEWPGHWQQREQRCWQSGRASVEHWFRWSGPTLSAWVTAVCRYERWDLLAPLLLLANYCLQPMVIEMRCQQVQSFFAHRPFRERQQFAQRWLQSYRWLNQLVEIERQCKSTHPVDREPTHQLFLQSLEQQPLTLPSQRLHQIRRRFQIVL